MTLNWGYKILFLYTGFVGGMLFLVYKCTQQNIDLVADNYYEKELQFQDQINRTNNATAEGFRLKMAYEPASASITVAYPATLNDKKVAGEIHLFRPDNAKLDIKIPVNATNGIQTIDASKLAKGYWRVQTSWQVGETPLYQEEKIFIQ
jgi:nitrogen fixation protein FixH